MFFCLNLYYYKLVFQIENVLYRDPSGSVLVLRSQPSSSSVMLEEWESTWKSPKPFSVLLQSRDSNFCSTLR